ncbi:hypothetical protein T492DRAFT_599358 [Pavlovales sp. CCMP2436]|nr:hypothetical protein T492DRAFT_599358 [Pavlovales sp. CCMP2436]
MYYYVLLCFVMFYYVLLCFIMFCYVLLCFIMFCYVAPSTHPPSPWLWERWLS